MREHEKRHGQVEPKKKSPKKTKKTVSWNDDLNTTVHIENNKVSLNKENVKSLKFMSEHLDNLMSFMANRRQLINLNNLKIQYEKVTRTCFNFDLFQALLYLNMYIVEIVDTQLVVSFKNIDLPITPSKANERKQQVSDMLNILTGDKKTYLFKLPLPEIKKNAYQSAKEILRENRDIESSEEEVSFKSLTEKVKHNEAKKVKYNEKKKNMDEKWQRERMPNFVRIIYNIFKAEKKSALRMDYLHEKLRFILKSENIKQDIDYLTTKTNGWFSNFGKYYILETVKDPDEVLSLF